MLAEEFANYDQNPSYHKMFELAGVAEALLAKTSSTRVRGNTMGRKQLDPVSPLQSIKEIEVVAVQS